MQTNSIYVLKKIVSHLHVRSCLKLTLTCLLTNIYHRSTQNMLLIQKKTCNFMARWYHAFNLAMYFKVSPQCHAIHSVFISNRHKTIQVKRMHFIQLHTWQDKQEQEDTRRLFHKKNNRRLLSQTTVNSNGGWEREFHYIIMLFTVTHEYMHCCDDNIYDCCDEWGDGFCDCRGR